MHETHSAPKLGEKGVARERRRDQRSRAQRRRVGERVPVVAAVRGVQVDEDVRLPRGEHRERRARLRRFGLDVVPVEVERVGIGSLADHCRTILRRAVSLLGSDALVTVDVVDRDGDEHDRVEDVELLLEEQIAEQRLERFLALHLAAVDVGLDVNDRSVHPAGLCRGRDQRPRRNDVRDLSSLCGSTDRTDDDLRAKCAQRIDEAPHVVIRRRLREPRALRAGERPDPVVVDAIDPSLRRGASGHRRLGSSCCGSGTARGRRAAPTGHSCGQQQRGDRARHRAVLPQVVRGWIHRSTNCTLPRRARAREQGIRHQRTGRPSLG
jgi:hypothetical protein